MILASFKCKSGASNLYIRLELKMRTGACNDLKKQEGETCSPCFFEHFKFAKILLEKSQRIDVVAN